jgi:hypothetical protein
MQSYYVSDGSCIVIIDATNEDDARDICRTTGFDLIGVVTGAGDAVHSR